MLVRQLPTTPPPPQPSPLVTSIYNSSTSSPIAPLFLLPTPPSLYLISFFKFLSPLFLAPFSPPLSYPSFTIQSPFLGSTPISNLPISPFSLLLIIFPISFSLLFSTSIFLSLATLIRFSFDPCTPPLSLPPLLLSLLHSHSPPPLLLSLPYTR